MHDAGPSRRPAVACGLNPEIRHAPIPIDSIHLPIAFKPMHIRRAATFVISSWFLADHFRQPAPWPLPRPWPGNPWQQDAGGGGGGFVDRMDEPSDESPDALAGPAGAGLGGAATVFCAAHCRHGGDRSRVEHVSALRGLGADRRHGPVALAPAMGALR